MAEAPAPDLIECVVGFRVWNLLLEDAAHPEKGGRLLGTGVCGAQPWEPVTTARCRVGDDHRAPAPNCGCGLYANHSPTSGGLGAVKSEDAYNGRDETELLP